MHRRVKKAPSANLYETCMRHDIPWRNSLVLRLDHCNYA
jgi:hypothetical protein